MVVLLGSTATYIFAQQAAGGKGTVSGRLIDGANNQPLDYATVALISKANNQVAKSLQTDAQGNFKLTGVANGRYQVRITFVSYLTYTKDSLIISDARPAIQLGTIRMRQSKGTLKEVVVTGQRSQIQLGTDKKVFSVDQSLVSQGGSATDLLANVPTVQVDVDGNVNLRGSNNVRVLINGKPSALTGSSVSDILQSIPASSIENIEVITNPSSKYDAEGQSGIINIILKKNASLGFNGSVSGTAGTQKTYNGNLNLAYQTSKVNIYGNYSYRRGDRVGNGFTNKTITSGNDVTTQNQVSDQTFSFKGHNIRTGIDYNLDKNNTLSFSNNINIRDRDRFQNGTTNTALNGFRTQILEQDNKSYGSGTNLDFNLDYVHKFAKPKEELTTNIGYSTERNSNTDYLNTNRFYFPTTFDPFYQNNYTKGRQGNLNLQADYTLPLKNGKIEAGYRTTINRNENDYMVDTAGAITGPFLRQLDQTYNFVYKENVNAAYTNYQHQFGQYGVQVGLRLEDAHIRTELETRQANIGPTNFKNDYFRVYPSVFLTDKLTENQTLQLSYTRRVSRPRDRQISPFLDRSNPLNFQQGNPNLLPEDIHSFELSYINYYKTLTLTSSLYYRLTNNNIQNIQEPYLNSLDTTLNTFRNIKSASNAGYELIAKVTPSSALDFTFNANVFYRYIDGVPEYKIPTTSGWSYNGNLTANIKPLPKLGFQLRGDYQGRQVIAQGYMRAMYGLDGAIRYDITKALNVSVSARDIFNTRRFKSDINFQNTAGTQYTNQYSERRFSTRVVLFTASYRFGSTGANRQRQRRQQQDQDNPDDTIQPTNSVGGGPSVK
ncbi:outer membrane beta-barrel family protein [Mucilaginibacter koreensis]